MSKDLRESKEVGKPDQFGSDVRAVHNSLADGSASNATTYEVEPSVNKELHKEVKVQVEESDAALVSLAGNRNKLVRKFEKLQQEKTEPMPRQAPRVASAAPSIPPRSLSFANREQQPVRVISEQERYDAELARKLSEMSDNDIPTFLAQEEKRREVEKQKEQLARQSKEDQELANKLANMDDNQVAAYFAAQELIQGNGKGR